MLNPNRNLALLRTIVDGEALDGGGSDAAPAAPAVPDSPAVAKTNTGFTTADLDAAREKAREQEKGKLYPEIERLKTELAKRDEQISAWQKAQEEAAEAKRKQADEDLDLRTLLQKKEEEWSNRIQEEAKQREQAFALLERERQFQELQAYRQSRLTQEEDSIIPELRDLVAGNSAEEIEASINSLKERSAAITNSVQAAMQQARQGMTGSRVTSPAAGPLDTDPDNRSFTDADVRSMSLADYAKNRARLLGSAASNRNQGIFGSLG